MHAVAKQAVLLEPGYWVKTTACVFIPVLDIPTRTYMQTRVRARTHTHAHTHTHINTHTHTHTHTHARARARALMQTYR
jgi:hypothetical protein